MFLYEVHGKYKLLFATYEIGRFMFSNFRGSLNLVSCERVFIPTIVPLVTATTQHDAASACHWNNMVKESL
jgi:hypothetical protein